MSWTKLCDGAPPPCRELSEVKRAGCEVCRGTEWAEWWREGALCRREDDWHSREEDGVAYIRRETIGEISVADPDPGSGAFLTPVSGMAKNQNPDPR